MLKRWLANTLCFLHSHSLPFSTFTVIRYCYVFISVADGSTGAPHPSQDADMQKDRHEGNRSQGAKVSLDWLRWHHLEINYFTLAFKGVITSLLDL